VGEGLLEGLGAMEPKIHKGGAVNSCKSVNKIYFAIDIAYAPVLPSTSISQSPLHPLQPPIPSYQHTKVGGAPMLQAGCSINLEPYTATEYTVAAYDSRTFGRLCQIKKLISFTTKIQKLISSSVLYGFT
jgi:hypothetical protein